MDYLERVEEIDQHVATTGQAPEYPPAPKLLALYNRLQQWKCLPIAGGYLDQPAHLMLALNRVRIALDDWEQIRATNRALSKGGTSSSAGPVIQAKIPPPFNSEK